MNSKDDALIASEARRIVQDYEAQHLSGFPAYELNEEQIYFLAKGFLLRNGELPRWGQSTGLMDKHGVEIHQGDVIRSGMRRGDPAGWSEELVDWCGGEWVLRCPKTGEKMQMQNDSELREIIGYQRQGRP